VLGTAIAVVVTLFVWGAGDGLTRMTIIVGGALGERHRGS
jgi:hypothetical protein